MLERIVTYLFYLNKEVVLTSIYQDFLIMLNLAILILLVDVLRYGKSLIFTLLLIYLKNKNFNGNLRVNWDWRVL